MRYLCKKGITNVTPGVVYNITYVDGIIFVVERDDGSMMKMTYDIFKRHFSIIESEDKEENNFYFDEVK